MDPHTGAPYGSVGESRQVRPVCACANTQRACVRAHAPERSPPPCAPARCVCASESACAEPPARRLARSPLARSLALARPPVCAVLSQGRSSFTRLAAAAGALMAVMCVAALAARQSPSALQLAEKRAMTIHAAVARHGYDGVSANIHVQLKSLSASERAAIGRLSATERAELEGEIMLKAAQQTLERAAALKKQQHPQLKQIAVRHQMLQANDTNATNATDSTEGEESANAGATAWLDSQPDPSTWTDPLPTPFDLKKYLKCQPTFDLSAWLKDSSEKLKPGCPTTRLTNCADTDFEVRSFRALARLGAGTARPGERTGSEHVWTHSHRPLFTVHTPHACTHARTHTHTQGIPFLPRQEGIPFLPRLAGFLAQLGFLGEATRKWDFLRNSCRGRNGIPAAAGCGQHTTCFRQE